MYWSSCVLLRLPGICIRAPGNFLFCRDFFGPFFATIDMVALHDHRSKCPPNTGGRSYLQVFYPANGRHMTRFAPTVWQPSWHEGSIPSDVFKEIRNLVFFLHSLIVDPPLHMAGLPYSTHKYFPHISRGTSLSCLEQGLYNAPDSVKWMYMHLWCIHWWYIKVVYTQMHLVWVYKSCQTIFVAFPFCIMQHMCTRALRYSSTSTACHHLLSRWNIHRSILFRSASFAEQFLSQLAPALCSRVLRHSLSAFFQLNGAQAGVLFSITCFSAC